jgi:hypothetical protein
MKTALIATLGSRDVIIDKHILEEKYTDRIQNVFDKKGNLLSRYAGELLLKEYNKLKNHIEIPILIPTLEYLLNKHEKIDLLILLATNQPDKHPNDTIYYAQIIQKAIAERFPKKFPDVRIKEIKENTVIFLDSMYNYFSGEFSKKPFCLLSEPEYEKIYLHLVGGIDAINTAVRLVAIKTFGKKIVAELYVNEQNKECIPILSVRQFLEENEKHSALRMLENYFYEGILSLEYLHDEIKIMSQYAHKRLLFDFEGAANQLKELSDKHRDWCNKELEAIRPLKEKNSDTLMKELFWNLYIKYHQKNYVDFLLRLFRLTEEILRRDVLTIINTGYTEDNWGKTFLLYLNQNHELKQWLETRKLKYEVDNPSTTLLLHILEYYSDKNQYDNNAYVLLSTIHSLAQIRNKSIGAHAFEKITEGEMNEKLKNHGFEISKLFAHLKSYLKIEENPYDKLNQKIRSLLA